MAAGRGQVSGPEPLWLVSSAAPLLTRGEVHLWRFPLTTSMTELAALQSLLAADEVQRAVRLLDPHKAQAFIVGRGRLRQILGAYLQCDPATLDFAYNRNGKPALRTPANPLHFNLSHSGAWAVLALTADVEIGVDIERIDPLLDYERLAAQYFSDAERAALAMVVMPRRRRVFYRLWTRKEALLKGQGRGFTASAVVEERVWQLRSFWLAPGYVAAIACAGEIEALRRWQVG